MPLSERQPFRWDLVRPDRLGSLLDDVPPPDLWFLDELAACAGKVVARSGDGDLLFVGRSLDSMHDLLSGAFAASAAADRIRRLPLSSVHWWVTVPAEARDVLTAAGLTPAALQRRRRPVTFVDVVSSGGTFESLYTLLRDWVAEDGAQWDVVRRKLRFVGVTDRKPTSPKTWRWHQQVTWPRHLAAGAVVNVSMAPGPWAYFANRQPKLSRSFHVDGCFFHPPGPRRDEKVTGALAEAVAVVEFGRSRAGRRAIAGAMTGEPVMSQRWLRALVTDLRL